MSNQAAVSPAPVAKTDHAGIKAKMLQVLAVVLDIQTSYEAYERPSDVNHEILEPLWRARIEQAGATNVSFETTPAGKQSWKYVLEVGFTLEIGNCKYKVQAIGTDAPKGYNSTAEWIRDVKRWPESEKAMEKKECKGFHFPASNPKPNQATFNELQARCVTELENRHAYMLVDAAKAFDNCKFDGRPTYGVNVYPNGYSLYFALKPQSGAQSETLSGGLKEFEGKWIPRFSHDAIAMQIFRNRVAQAAWTRKWIAGEVTIFDKSPSKVQVEVSKAIEERNRAEKQVELAQPAPAGITATYYCNPKTGLTKSFLVKGDTRPHKEAYKEIGGTWCSGLGGWIFGLGRESQFKKAFPTVQWVASGSTSNKHP